MEQYITVSTQPFGFANAYLGGAGRIRTRKLAAEKKVGKSRGAVSLASASAGDDVSAGGPPVGGPPVSPGGLESGAGGPGRRRRRGGQREGQPRAGGNAAPPSRRDHGSGSAGPAEKGTSKSDSQTGRGRPGGNSLGEPAAGERQGEESEAGDDTSAELSAGTGEERGRRQRRRRRGGRGPQGSDTSPPGQPKPDGPSETFGEGLG